MLLLPPIRFIAIARFSCASLLIEPNDIAPVLKRLTISLAGSTSSIGTGATVGLELQQAAQRRQIAAVVVDQPRVLLEQPVVARAHRVLQLRDGVRVVHVELAAPAPLVLAADVEFAVEVGTASRRRSRCRLAVSRAIASRPTPPMRDARPGEVLVDHLAG